MDDSHDRLIGALAANLAPVRRLPPPALRMLRWLILVAALAAALAPRQLRERRADPPGLFPALNSGGKIDGFVGMAFIGMRGMHFAPAAVQLAQIVDRAPLDDDPQPGIERTPRIVGRARAMQGQQCLLHHVVSAVGRDAAAAGKADDERHAIAQQRLVGDAVA